MPKSLDELFTHKDPLPETIKEKIEKSAQYMQDWFCKEGNVPPGALLIDDKGQGHLIGIDMPDAKGGARDNIADMIKDMARKVQPVAVLFSAESWLLDYDAVAKALHLNSKDFVVDDKEASEAIGEFMMQIHRTWTTLYGTIAKAPGAQEALYWNLETIWGNYVRKVMIKRQGKEKPSLIDSDCGWTKMPEDSSLGGRFANFLKKTPTTDDVPA